MKASELQVGVITGTHGIKGLVKVLPFTDDPERFANMHEVTAVCVNGQRIPLEITHAGPHKDRILVSFKGMDNINLVEPAEKIRCDHPHNRTLLAHIQIVCLIIPYSRLPLWIIYTASL